MLKEYILKIKKTFFKRKEFFLLIGITLVGFILRMINIAVEPFWCDELLSLTIVKHYLGDPSGLWSYLQLVEVHPPLYYYLIQGWGSLFGFTEAPIRFLSLIFSLGTIYLTYWAGLVLFKSKKIGLLAAFFCAILPMQIEFGQEARPYAMYCFLGILSIILLAKYFKEQKTKTKIILASGYILCSLIGIYLHYSYALIIITTASYWLIRLIINKSGKEFLWWLGAMTIIFLGFYPWLATLIFKTFLINDVITYPPRTFYYARDFAFFERALNSLIWTTKEIPTILEIIVAVGVKIMLVGLVFQIIKKNQLWLAKYKTNLLYLGWIFMISILAFLILPSSTTYTNLMYRHIIFDSVILALLLGALFIQIKNIKWRIIWLSLFLISLMTFQVKIIGDDSLYDINHRLKIMVDYINEQYQDGDIIMTAASFTRPQFNYYLRQGLPEIIGIYSTQLLIDDFMATKDTLGMMENEAQLRYSLTDWPGLDTKMNYLVKKNNATRVWVIGDGNKGQIRKWFTFNGWWIGFEPIGPLFPLTLYVK